MKTALLAPAASTTATKKPLSFEEQIARVKAGAPIAAKVAIPAKPVVAGGSSLGGL